VVIDVCGGEEEDILSAEQLVEVVVEVSGILVAAAKAYVDVFMLCCDARSHDCAAASRQIAQCDIAPDVICESGYQFIILVLLCKTAYELLGRHMAQR
jgi:hypothetical protein